MSLTSLESVVKKLSSIRENKKVVFTNGCFDILHAGHVRCLQAAKDFGDFLVVGLNSDESIKRIKGPERPVQSESDRAEILCALRAVDFVVLFGDDTPIELIKNIKPDVLAKGGDWSVDQIVGGDFVQSYGGAVESIPYIEGKSTTNIIEKMQS